MNKTFKRLLLLGSHGLALAVGFAAGIYTLPLLVAPPSPTGASLQQAAQAAQYSGRFVRELAGSDTLHWGEGELAVGPDAIALSGRLAPGPDYKLYLSPEFVEDEAQFERLKPRMVRVGDVKTFKDFLVPVPPGVDVSKYTTVVIWCESFGEFITAAMYR